MSANGARDAGRVPDAAQRRQFHRERRSLQPSFAAALIADTRVVSRNRGRPLRGASRPRILAEALRLCWENDGFATQLIYRARARLHGLGVPVLPSLLHRLSIILSGVYIGTPVVIEPGVHIQHGMVVIDGITSIGAGSSIGPFTSIGLTAGRLYGPRIGRNVAVGTGARVLGHLEVGDGARIGANAVVLDDVPEQSTVAGVPAVVVRDRRSE